MRNWSRHASATRRRWPLALLSSAVALSACGRGGGSAPPSRLELGANATCTGVGGEASASIRPSLGVRAHGPGPAEVLAAMCPLDVEGTTVSVEDVERGAALIFETAGDAGALRSRIATATTLHDQRAATEGCDGASEPPRSEATYEPTDRGARLVLRAVDPAEADAVRAQAREEAERLAAGRCLLADAGDRPRPRAARRRPIGLIASVGRRRTARR
jgi:hypothetical protein